MARMKATPINDFYAHGGVLRQDGRLTHQVFLAEVKSPAESKYPWDYYKIISTLEPDKAFRPMADGGCDFVAHYHTSHEKRHRFAASNERPPV
jgi:branched-chain amino acid transport system substrate-binding protein